MARKKDFWAVSDHLWINGRDMFLDGHAIECASKEHAREVFSQLREWVHDLGETLYREGYDEACADMNLGLEKMRTKAAKGKS